MVGSAAPYILSQIRKYLLPIGSHTETNVYHLVRFMIQTYPIAKTITTFADLKQKFKLSPTENELFFSEWQQDLP